MCDRKYRWLDGQMMKYCRIFLRFVLFLRKTVTSDFVLAFDFWNVISKLQAARQSDDEILLNQLWAPTFGYFEKLLCFYRAPITLFWLAAIYRWNSPQLTAVYCNSLQHSLL